MLELETGLLWLACFVCLVVTLRRTLEALENKAILEHDVAVGATIATECVFDARQGTHTGR
jgi:hypothetical protein